MIEKAMTVGLIIPWSKVQVLPDPPINTMLSEEKTMIVFMPRNEFGTLK